MGIQKNSNVPLETFPAFVHLFDIIVFVHWFYGSPTQPSTSPKLYMNVSHALTTFAHFGIVLVAATWQLNAPNKLALVNVSSLPAQAEQQVKLADAELRETKALEDRGGLEFLEGPGRFKW